MQIMQNELMDSQLHYEQYFKWFVAIENDGRRVEMFCCTWSTKTSLKIFD